VRQKTVHLLDIAPSWELLQMLCGVIPEMISTRMDGLTKLGIILIGKNNPHSPNPQRKLRPKMNNELMPDLLPCPFCGGEAKEMRETSLVKFGCDKCAVKPHSYYQISFPEWRDDAITEWNTRANRAAPSPVGDDIYTIPETCWSPKIVMTEKEAAEYHAKWSEERRQQMLYADKRIGELKAEIIALKAQAPAPKAAEDGYIGAKQVLETMLMLFTLFPVFKGEWVNQKAWTEHDENVENACRKLLTDADAAMKNTPTPPNSALDDGAVDELLEDLDAILDKHGAHNTGRGRGIYLRVKAALRNTEMKGE